MTPTAQLFFILSLAAALTYGGLGMRALLWNPRGRGNQALALLCAGCGTWSFSMAMILTSFDRDGALFWYRVAATGYLVAPAAALHAYLRLTHVEWIASRQWIEPLLYLPVPIFIFRNWLAFIGPVDVLQTQHGWVERIGHFDGWYSSYVAYLLIFAAATVTTSALRWRAATNRTERLQSVWLTVGGAVLIPLIAGFGLLLPVVRPGLPEVSHLLALVWVLAAWKAMEIRNPWTLTPQLVADQLLEALSEAVLITDTSGRVQIANPAAQELFGSSSKALRGSHLSLLTPLRDAGLITDNRIRTDVKDLEVEVRSSVMVRPEGSEDAAESSAAPTEPGSTPQRGDAPKSRWFAISTSAVLNRLDEAVGVLVTLRNVTDTKAAEHELTYRATHDPLTGLANRHLLDSRLQEVAGAAGGRSFAVLVIDLDSFKAINDRHGHAIGDQLLSLLAKRLRGCLRTNDTAARVGGDEFVVLVAEGAGPERVLSVAQRLLAACRRPFEVEGELLMVDASIGIALGTAGTATPEEIMSRADRAMYRAKAKPDDPIVLTVEPDDPADEASAPRLEN
jgi:diguanylate cyclase (GGDEF)-like protein/PAS domain S-box-containing protein